jgi:hypothetical protein
MPRDCRQPRATVGDAQLEVTAVAEYTYSTDALDAAAHALADEPGMTPQKAGQAMQFVVYAVMLERGTLPAEEGGEDA